METVSILTGLMIGVVVGIIFGLLLAVELMNWLGTGGQYS